MNAAKVGDRIEIVSMRDEPGYAGREGVVRSIDSMGQLHGSWGGLAVIPEVDSFQILKEGGKNEN